MWKAFFISRREFYFSFKKLFETGSHYVAQVGPKLKLSMGTEIDVPDAHGRAPPVPDTIIIISPVRHVTRKGPQKQMAKLGLKSKSAQ